MAKDIYIDDNEIINPIDYEKKYNDIVKELWEGLFCNLNAGKADKIVLDETGNVIGEQKGTPTQKFSKDAIMQDIQPAQVAIMLNRLLRRYRPFSLADAKRLTPEDYLCAYEWFCKLMEYINKYIVFIPDKQTYSAFVNITDDIYNELLIDQTFGSTFKSIDNGFISTNFVGAQAGIIDSKSTISKLQTRDAGHNLIKNPEAITFNNFQTIDKMQVNAQLEKWKAMASIGYKPNKNGKNND